MQPEAGIVGLLIERTEVAELSAMGAYLAGGASGVFAWDGLKHIDRGAERFVSATVMRVTNAEPGYARSLGLQVKDNELASV